MILQYDCIDLLFHQTLLGDIGNASKTLKRYHSVWKKFGFTPEFYQITAGLPIKDRESYPLRPGSVDCMFTFLWFVSELPSKLIKNIRCVELYVPSVVSV